MCWERGKYEGTPPLSRYGHTANSIGPHILIFGKIFFFLILSLILFFNFLGGWEFSRATNEVVVLRDMSAGGP
jgi:hypothetical protein